MPEFDSPLGKKKVAGQPMREFNVPDESEFVENSVNPVFNAQRARASAGNMPPPPSPFNTEAMYGNLPSEQDLAAAEREIQAARAAKRSGKERLSEGAKKRIDMLLGMTRTTRQCEVEGVTFVLQSLKAKEMREAIILASQFDGNVQSPFEIRKQFLARSIVQVGDIDINQFIGSEDFESKLAFIDELDESLSNRLYDEYVALVKDARGKFSIKNENEVQEVISDLKK